AQADIRFVGFTGLYLVHDWYTSMAKTVLQGFFQYLLRVVWISDDPAPSSSAVATSIAVGAS
ncbi:hypothetical protein PQR05_08195, partial [Paraburkholderia sediminicola]|uniref:hypothetical protein n=1 Tax=Paraburkholderia sediminicola TaxID=458836 RepID=UPI0038BA007D